MVFDITELFSNEDLIKLLNDNLNHEDFNDIIMRDEFDTCIDIVLNKVFDLYKIKEKKIKYNININTSNVKSTKNKSQNEININLEKKDINKAKETFINNYCASFIGNVNLNNRKISIDYDDEYSFKNIN